MYSTRDGFYEEKLNALMFVPQQELSREQAYWLPANERASQTSNPNSPIFDDLEAEYEQCVLDNKNLTIEKKNLLIRNDCLIAECLEKDICSIVLTSDIVVPPSSNCLCEDLRSACDREHTKFLNLNLDAQINIMKVLNVGSTEGSCDQQALETDRIQLKDTITSLRIQLDGLKVENVLRLKKKVLSYISTTQNVLTGSKPTPLLRRGQSVKTHSGASKTVPKRAPRNHSSLPVKSANARRVEAHHRTLNKKNRVDSNLLVKHSVSVSKLNNVCAACNKSLVIANHTDCLVMCDGSVNVKPHQTKRFKRQPKKEWKPIKRVWKPISKPVANSKPQWKPTGSFSLI
ncbi:hypothetical protein Tco_0684489 [Tanacetum coccineum]